MREDILIPKQVAARWGCSEQHVRNMVNRGELGHFRLGGKLLRIPLSAVEEAECAIKASFTTSDGSSRPATPKANASSRSGRTGSAAGSASAPVSRLRLAAVRQPSTPKP
ncbi:hypothetical protein CRT23_12065 [Methylobacterium sp. V23]|nr:hypothetical protein CRT23_12065 [Methylobacterium sp. V23]